MSENDFNNIKEIGNTYKSGNINQTITLLVNQWPELDNDADLYKKLNHTASYRLINRLCVSHFDMLEKEQDAFETCKKVIKHSLKIDIK